MPNPKSRAPSALPSWLLVSASWAASAAAPLPAQEPGPAAAATQGKVVRPAEAVDARQIRWQRSLDDALALQRATGRPLLLALNMDGESASDRIVREEYQDPAFVAMTRGCICVAGSVFRHNARDHDDQGRRIPCPKLGEITCGEHIALEPALWERFLSDGERIAPRHALVLPDGTKAFDIALSWDLRDVDRALAKAVEGIEPWDVAASAFPSWQELAARRDQRGRAQLEAALLRIRDDATWNAAMGAIGAHGDAGSLEALRVAVARLPTMQVHAQVAVCDAATKLSLGDEVRSAMQQLLQTAGLEPGSPSAPPGSAALSSRRNRFGGRPDTFAIALAAAGGPAVTDPQLTSFELRGQPIAAVLQRAHVVTRSEPTLPREQPDFSAMPTAAELEQRLTEFDAARQPGAEDAAFLYAFGKASLDLARRRIEEGGKDAELLLQDAARSLDLALAKAPTTAAWWIERARASWFLQRFEQQVEAGRKALELAGDDEAIATEAKRWIGDGCARRLAEFTGAGVMAEFANLVEALRSFGEVAAGPYGRARDWVTYGAFCGALGLLREQQAILLTGAMRFPADAELRQALNAALWTCGRIDLAPVAAERIAHSRAPSGDTSWFAGYAWILAGEDLRRAQDFLAAEHAYRQAVAWFDDAAQQNPDYAATARFYAAAAIVGEALATVVHDQGTAGTLLVGAIEQGADLTTLRDGLGCDLFDLVDRIVEWRARGAGADGIALLDQIDAVDAENPFWASAVSDALLRESLRIYGKNEQGFDLYHHDADGNPLQLGGPWLDAAVTAGRRAAERARTPEDKKPLAQALTIRAERRLAAGSWDRVREDLREAAQALGIAAPAEGAADDAWRALATTLRAALGEPRPREREGR